MKESRSISTTAAAIPGFIVGILWIAMAAAALLSAFRGYRNDRLDWGLGWGIVGLFLLAAGLAALVGTWWHNYRLKPRHHQHPHH